MILMRRLVMLCLFIVLFNNNVRRVTAHPTLFNLVRDLIQNNIAGIPIIHEKTEWDFDPKVGQKRRVQYEQENGRKGEIAIEKIGMGIGYNGPWGVKVKESTNKIVR